MNGHAGCEQKAAHEAEQRASELSSQQLQHSSLRSAHEGALKELDAMHTNHSSAAKRAEEALAELALVRETQQALTKQASVALKTYPRVLSHGNAFPLF